MGSLSERQIATAVGVWSQLALERRPLRPEVVEQFRERLTKFLTDPPPRLGFDGVHLATEVTPDPTLALAWELAGVAVVGHTLLPWYHQTRFVDGGVELRRGKDAAWEPVPLIEDPGSPETNA